MALTRPLESGFITVLIVVISHTPEVGPAGLNMGKLPNSFISESVS